MIRSPNTLSGVIPQLSDTKLATGRGSADRAFGLILDCGGFIAVLSAPIGLLRLLGEYWAGHYHKVLVPCAVFLSFRFLVVWTSRRSRLDLLSWMLLAYISQGVVVGLLRMGEGRYFLSHLGTGLFMFSVYTAARMAVMMNCSFDRRLDRWARRIFWAFLITMAVFWILNVTVYRGSLYLGIGTGALALPLAYSVIRNQVWYSALCCLLVVSSGKRGAIVALALSTGVGLAWTLRARERRRKFVRSSISIAVLFALLTPILPDLLRRSEDAAFVVDSIIARISSLDIRDPTFDLDQTSAGRSQELQLAFERFAAEDSNWITGLGFGWSYFFDARIVGLETSDYWSHYVHLSAANLVLCAGVVLGCAIVIEILRISLAGIWTGYRGSATDALLAIFLTSQLTNSLFGFSFSIDPLLWTTLGIVSGRATMARARHSRPMTQQQI